MLLVPLMSRLLPAGWLSVARSLSTAAAEAPAPQTRTKRKVSAYQAFIAFSIKGAVGDRIQDKMKASAAAWRALSDDDKAQYVTKAEELNTDLPQVLVKLRRKHRPPRVSGMSALNLFTKEQYALVEGQNNSERFKALHVAWKALTPEEQLRYQTAAVIENTKCRTEVAAKPPPPSPSSPPVSKPKAPHTSPAIHRPLRKRNLTPLNMFVKEQYDSVLDEKVHGRLKALGTAWRALTPEERQQYKEAADAENAKRSAKIAAKPPPPSPSSPAGSKPNARHTPPEVNIDRPRRVQKVSALNLFFQEQFVLVPVQKHIDRFKALHAAWKALTPEERQRYKEVANTKKVNRQGSVIHKPAFPSLSPPLSSHLRTLSDLRIHNPSAPSLQTLPMAEHQPSDLSH